MRWSFLVCLALVACEPVRSDAILDPDGGADAAAGPCAACDEAATCDPAAPTPCTCPLGYFGDGTTCTAVVVGLDGQRMESACVNDTAEDACNAELSPAWTGKADPGEGSFRVTLRVRGVVEQKTYEGGSRVGYWQVGGTPDATGFNAYHLKVGADDYYLNAGESKIRHCWAIDYTQSVIVRGGDDLLFEVVSTDTALIKNRDEAGVPIVVAGIPPAPDSFNGQFVQIDVERIEPVD
jgi:hypothetical protein